MERHGSDLNEKHSISNRTTATFPLLYVSGPAQMHFKKLEVTGTEGEAFSVIMIYMKVEVLWYIWVVSRYIHTNLIYCVPS